LATVERSFPTAFAAPVVRKLNSRNRFNEDIWRDKMPHYKHMQSDLAKRYALDSAADAGRYVDQ